MSSLQHEVEHWQNFQGEGIFLLLQLLDINPYNCLTLACATVVYS